jgi:hypothetical protein
VCLRGDRWKSIDEEQLAALARMQCTYEEIASVLGISKRRFIDHLDREPRLREIVEEGREYGRASIRRAQFKLLNDGNPTTAIWLGKQYLGPAGPWRSP